MITADYVHEVQHVYIHVYICIIYMCIYHINVSILLCVYIYITYMCIYSGYIYGICIHIHIWNLDGISLI